MADDQSASPVSQKPARYSKYDVAMFAAQFMANKQGGSKSTKEDATSNYFTMVRNKIGGSVATMGDRNDITKSELLGVITEVEKAATNKFFPDALRAQSRLIVEGLRAASNAMDTGRIAAMEERVTGGASRAYGHLSSRPVSSGVGRVVSAAPVREEKAKTEEGDAKPAKRTAVAKPPRRRAVGGTGINPETAEQELQTAWDELVTLLNPENKTGKESPYGMKWLNQEGLEKVLAWKDSSRAATFPPLNTALKEAQSPHAEKARELLSRINKLCTVVKQQRAEQREDSAITLVSSVPKPVEENLPTLPSDVVPLVDAETISHALKDVKRVSQSFSDAWREAEEHFKGQYTGGALEMFGLDNPQLALSFITRDKFKALVEPYRGALDEKGDQLIDQLIATHAQFRDLPGVREGRIVA